MTKAAIIPMEQGDTLICVLHESEVSAVSDHLVCTLKDSRGRSKGAHISPNGFPDALHITGISEVDVEFTSLKSFEIRAKK